MGSVTGLVDARPEAPEEFSLGELFMGRNPLVAFYHRAQLNHRIQLNIVKFVVGLEKYI